MLALALLYLVGHFIFNVIFMKDEKTQIEVVCLCGECDNEDRFNPSLVELYRPMLEKYGGEPLPVVAK